MGLAFFRGPQCRGSYGQRWLKGAGRERPFSLILGGYVGWSHKNITALGACKNYGKSWYFVHR